MGYRHINNLYKDQTVLMFKKLYALEKIHGTSAYIDFNWVIIPENNFFGYEIHYFSGGENYENFIKFFNTKELIDKAIELGFQKSFTVYGEVYGGKQQGMSETYGKELRFIAFEVKIGEKFSDVPFAEQICQTLRLEFVHYEEVDANPEILDKLSVAPSIQAKRNGVESPKMMREGIVLRPLKEFLHPDGIGRIMAKHKNPEYAEREHAPKIKNSEELKILEDAKKIAQEWVVPMRLEHVLDKLKAEGMELDEKKMNQIIKAMVEDVYREAKGEIVESKEVYKAIGKRTAKLFIEKLKSEIK